MQHCRKLLSRTQTTSLLSATTQSSFQPFPTQLRSKQSRIFKLHDSKFSSISPSIRYLSTTAQPLSLSLISSSSYRLYSRQRRNPLKLPPISSFTSSKRQFSSKTPSTSPKSSQSFIELPNEVNPEISTSSGDGFFSKFLKPKSDAPINILEKYKGVENMTWENPLHKLMPPELVPTAHKHPAIDPLHPWFFTKHPRNQSTPQITYEQLIKMHRFETMDPKLHTSSLQLEYTRLQQLQRAWIRQHRSENPFPEESAIAEEFWARPDVAPFSQHFLQHRASLIRQHKAGIEKQLKSLEKARAEAIKIKTQESQKSELDLIKQERNVDFPAKLLFVGAFSIFLLYVVGLLWDFHVDYFGEPPMHPKDAFKTALVHLGMVSNGPAPAEVQNNPTDAV